MTMLGAVVERGNTRFAVRAPRAEAVWLCLFDGDTETRHVMEREGDTWVATSPRDLAGARYGYRATGPWAPEAGCWFDPAKLLVDPYAVELDRRFIQNPALAEHGTDTAPSCPGPLSPVQYPHSL